MKISLVIATASLTLVSIPARAQDPRLANVRPLITINGAKEQNKLTLGAPGATMVVENQKFGEESQRPFIIRARGAVTTAATWKEYSLSFTPEKEGYVWLSLEGEYPPKEEPNIEFKVDYDKITVTGGSVENGDFEVRAEDGKPKFWKYSKDVVPNNSQPALSGSHYVAVTAKNRIGIALKVVAGQSVTITFSARAHTP